MGFFKRWKKGIDNITPLQQLKIKRTGFIGQACGLILAMVYLGVSGFSYWLLFLLFVLVVIMVDLLNVQQQINKIKNLMGG